MNFRTIFEKTAYLFFVFFMPLNLQAQVKISLDKPKANYAAKESMNFKLNAASGGVGTYEIYYDPRETNILIKKGNLNLRAGRDTLISYTHPGAGVIFFKATVNGASETTAVSFDPLSIKPFETEPADFDAFWDRQKAKLAAIPLNPVLTETRTLPNGSKLYTLQLNQIDNRKVFGYLCVPAGSGKFPAILSLPPYGNAPFEAESLVTTDFAERSKAISLSITVHNTPPNMTDPNAYNPDDLLNAETIYNRYMVLAGLRAIDYLTSRPDFNGSLGVSGLSQGGGLAIMVAGLDKRVNALMASNPAWCEHQAWRFKQASGFPLYLRKAKTLNLDSNKVINTIKYHDAAYFLKRYKGVFNLLVGYKDDVTPAASILAAYSQHTGSSRLVHMLNIGHNYPWNEYWQGRFDFFSRHLKDFKQAYDFKRTAIVNAGADQMNANGSSVNLAATIAGDADIISKLTYRWTKIDGPGSVIFFNPTAINTRAYYICCLRSLLSFCLCTSTALVLAHNRLCILQIKL